MAKKTGLPRYIQTGQSQGGQALKSDHNVSRSGTSVKGTTTARHYSVKATDNSGTIGKAQPLKNNSGGKDMRNTTLGRPYISTKPNRKVK